MAFPSQKLDRRMTIEEYLRFEETSEVKHEFHDGEVLEATEEAMALRYNRAMAFPAQKLDRRMTIEEYLRFEETSEVKHEYHDGEVLAMSGGTFDHAAVATNLVATLHARLRGGPCRVLDSNMRVAVAGSRRFVYPEASILCRPPQFHPEDLKRTTIINPRVVLEVLSESTESYDRGEKFEKYRQIESLEEYLLLAQDRPAVEGYLRQPDASWNLVAWQGLDAVARLRCLNIELPLAELYAGVELPAVDPAAESQPR